MANSKGDNVNKLMTKVKVWAKLRTKALLPTTDEGLSQLCQLVLQQAGMPDNDSTRQALCTAIMHADKNKIKFAPIEFVNHMKRMAASQAAYNVINDIRERDKRAKEVQVEQATEGTAG